jgi:hypothetical protein
MAEATAAGKLIAGRDKITDATAALFTGSVKIPERFIRTDEVQAAGEVVGEGETFDLPVVNMTSLLDPELSALETARLGSACREWGFFQVTINLRFTVIFFCVCVLHFDRESSLYIYRPVAAFL